MAPMTPPASHPVTPPNLLSTFPQTSPHTNSPEFKDVLSSRHSFVSVPAPTFPDADLASDFAFKHPIKHNKSQTWQDEWRRIVVESSPYNDLQGPLRQRRVPTPAEVAKAKVRRGWGYCARHVTYTRTVHMYDSRFETALLT